MLAVQIGDSKNLRRRKRAGARNADGKHQHETQPMRETTSGIDESNH
jgi:hypothetical protein